jgi:hypothetical protein
VVPVATKRASGGAEKALVAVQARAELLRRLIAEAHTSIDARVNDRVEAKRKAILEGAGKLSGVWPANWREELRDDWPE